MFTVVPEMVAKLLEKIPCGDAVLHDNPDETVIVPLYNRTKFTSVHTDVSEPAEIPGGGVTVTKILAERAVHTPFNSDVKVIFIGLFVVYDLITSDFNGPKTNPVNVALLGANVPNVVVDHRPYPLELTPVSGLVNKASPQIVWLPLGMFTPGTEVRFMFLVAVSLRQPVNVVVNVNPSVVDKLALSEREVKYLALNPLPIPTIVPVPLLADHLPEFDTVAAPTKVRTSEVASPQINCSVPTVITGAS